MTRRRWSPATWTRTRPRGGRSWRTSARQPDKPDALLKDDPPTGPAQDGNRARHDAPPKDEGVSQKDDARDPYARIDDDFDANGDVEKPPPTTFWGKVQAAAESVGRASFAAMTVVVTLGMMVAPYLLL